MRMIAIAALAAGALLAGGCSSAPAEPTEAEQRQAMCETFASITPPYFEIQEAMAVSSDPGSTSRQRTDALLFLSSTDKRDWPYDCDLPSDKVRFEKFYAEQQRARQSGGS